MKRKSIIIVSLLTAVIVIASVGYGIYRFQVREKENKILSTDGTYTIEEVPSADPLIVGKWANTANPLWYKAFYDDYDEETGMFWGKEWNEAEDVFEWDLNYHGNGWFRWEKKKSTLRIYATMDARDVPIHRAYKILVSTADSLVLQDAEYKNIIHRFTKNKN